MQIYELLKTDHDKVKTLLRKLTNLEDDAENCMELVDQIREELIPHSRAEEAVFYNSLRSVSAAKDLVRHSYEEHTEAETLLMTLQEMGRVDADFKQVAHKLKTALEEHIGQEEGQLFSIAREVFSSTEAKQFGAAFERMKPEIDIDDMEEDSAIDVAVNLMPPRFSDSLRNYGPSARPAH